MLAKYEAFVDEIIIADIGSTDRTVDIRKAGADVCVPNGIKISVKQKSLSGKANGKWILFLQPNEIISAEQLIKLNILWTILIQKATLYIDRRSENYRISSPVESLRLFRNRKEYRYKYKAFECILIYVWQIT